MSYNNLPERNQSKVVYRKGASQHDTIQVMKKVAHQSSKNPYFKTLVKKYNLKKDLNSLKRIFKFAFYNTFFESDNPKTQTIRSGMRTINDKRANCVDYCILLSSFLINMKVPHSFRMISTDPNNPNNLSHIYIVTPFGVLDPVIGQNQNGKEHLKNRTERTPFFLDEAPYVSNIDLRIF